MSKKKQPPKQPAKKETPVNVQPEKKSAKGIIIAVSALLLVAAIVLTVVFVVKPGSSDNGNTTTTGNPYTVPGANGYTYADYKGTSMPQEFVDILTQADADREAACNAYGVAVEIGDIKISHPEFISYYYDQFSLQKTEIEQSFQQTGSNHTGYDPKKLPDEQQCLNKGYTWAEEFTQKAIGVIQDNYRCFERALEKNITLTDDEVTATIYQFDVLETASKFQQRSAAELLEELYGKGYTEAMFKAREIMLAYNEKYAEVSKQEFADKYTEAELQAQLDKDINAYTVIVGRVYPIEGEYDAAEASKVSTEAEFLEYANSNYPKEGYVAETRTLCNYVDKTAISTSFGHEVADWMFSEDRVPGEIAVVEGQIFRYLVYIEKLPYLSVSRKIMYCGYDYEEGITDEEKARRLDVLQTRFDEWKNGGASQQAFSEMCYETSGTEAFDTRIGDFYYVFENWIFDDARKPGDAQVVDSDAGCAAFYFIEENAEDYDWKLRMSMDNGEADFLAEYEKDVEKNYEPKRDKVIINRAYKTVNVTITKQIAEAAKEQ